MLGKHWWLTAAVLSAAFLTHTAAAQTFTFTSEGVDYRLDLPSARWRAVPRLDVHGHVEFVYSENRADGYLRVREYLVAAGTTSEDLFRREESRTLRLLPGYVSCAPCEGERFEGRLGGAVFAYEYASGGKLMAGRIYYLEVNGRVFYSLHFTAGSEQLRALRGQADLIAGSFRLK